MRYAPHRPDVFFRKPDGLPLLCAEDDVLLAVCQLNADQLIALVQVNSDDAALFRVAVSA